MSLVALARQAADERRRGRDAEHGGDVSTPKSSQ